MSRKATIVVPALNEEQSISACLASIRSLTSAGPAFEIVLADNGSTDRTVEIARGFGAHIVTNPNLTIGGLRNHGARAGSGDLIAFLDADCTVDPEWLSSAAACMATTGAHVVGSVHRIPDDAGWVAVAASELSASKAGVVNYIPSGNLVVSRECFERVGGFSDTIRTNEDVDFCRRARQLGYLVFADPSITAVHHGVPRSAKDFFRREMWHGRDSFRVFFDDLKLVANLWVVLYALVFAATGVCGIAALVACAVTGSFLPLALYGVLFVGLVAVVWLSRVRRHRRHQLQILVHQLLYGSARAASLTMAVAGLLGRHSLSRGSWRVASAPDTPAGGPKAGVVGDETKHA
ncbi:MAG: glycosyltransferase [Gammaproteobacteria bacterium]